MFEPPCTPVHPADLAVTLSLSVAMSLDLLPASLKVDSSLPPEFPLRQTLKSPACPPGLFRCGHRLVVVGWYGHLFYFLTFF